MRAPRDASAAHRGDGGVRVGVATNAAKVQRGAAGRAQATIRHTPRAALAPEEKAAEAALGKAEAKGWSNPVASVEREGLLFLWHQASEEGA